MPPFDDHEDRPAARRGKPNAVMQDLGPLPVWGWAIVAIAGVFLYRKMTKPAAAAAQPDASQTIGAYPYATGLTLPWSGGGGTLPTPPAPTPPAAEAPPIFPHFVPKPYRDCPVGRSPMDSADRTQWTCATIDEFLLIRGLVSGFGPPAPHGPPAGRPPPKPGEIRPFWTFMLPGENLQQFYARNNLSPTGQPQ